MDAQQLLDKFTALLTCGAQELFHDNQDRMACSDLLATSNVIADDDLRLFFVGLEHNILTLTRGARFNTLDRPRDGGRWGLLSREKQGCRYNAEYLAQIAAYVEAIHDFAYPNQRVFFELPNVALKLDLAILGDDGAVVVLGEAKRALHMLDHLLIEVQKRYNRQDPGEQGRNEARQLAWRLWQTRARFLWFIGPGERRAYRVRYAPLLFERLPSLPRAEEISLAHIPKERLGIPVLRTQGSGPPKRSSADSDYRC
jgi:hypothetical protein